MRSLQPIRRRLPLLITALLLVVIVGFGWAAQRLLERKLISAGTERLRSASLRIASTLDESARRIRADVRRLATDTTVRRYLASRDGRLRDTVASILERRHRGSTQIVGLELRDASGIVVLSVGSLPVRASRVPAEGALGPDGAANTVWITPLETRADTVYYAVDAVLPGARGDTLGFIREHRRLSGQTPGLIAGLIGADAAFLIGNRSGGVWTDLATPLPSPVADARISTNVALSLTVAGDSDRLGIAEPISRTPWVGLVSIPQSAILAPARSLLREMLGLGVFALVFGMVGAWLIGRRITDPLQRLAEAASGVARGDYTQRVADDRRDEIGQVAASFNSMAGRVAETTRALEERLAELRKSEARYRRLVETTHEGVWTLDATGRTDYVNPRMAEMLGYAQDEMLGRGVPEFVPDEDRAHADHYLQRRRQGLADTYELRLRKRDGSVLAVLVNASPITDDAGRFAGALAMITDMTERRGLEAQLRQAQKMEAVGRLAGGVAHDFNNMLTAIKSYAAMLEQDLEGHDPRRGDAAEIGRAADRAASLTRQLLAFSRRQMLQPRVIDLNVTVEGLEGMLRRLIGEDIEVRTRLSADLGLTKADPGQIEQVIMNLVVNARDAMPDGGLLTIETSNAELDDEYARRHGVNPAEARGSYVMIAVSDSGHGMDRATQERVFEPFFTTKGPGKGTGLGLSTVYGIVKQSGGYVWCYSEPERGTTFKVYLPRLTEDAVPVKPEKRPAAVPRGTGHILLVEDDDAVRSVAARMLDRAGYRVTVATNGAEALALCEQGELRPDLVVCDMVMPTMGGAEFGRELLARRPDTRILFMSGYTEESVRRQGPIANGAAFLAKPFTLEQLATKVRDTLADGYRSPEPRRRTPTV